MTMSIFRDDSIEHFGPIDVSVSTYSGSEPSRTDTIPSIRTIESKLRRPDAAGNLPRERLNGLLKRSTANFAATLIVGRAGSGKTALAAGFASEAERSVWLTLDASDGEWPVFSHYLWAAIFGKQAAERKVNRFEITTMFHLMADITVKFEVSTESWPTVIVLDGIHHLFDSDWFSGFFELFIASLPATTHLLLLSRSKPPNPLWRLRSKQVLNVIDEKLLLFSVMESEQFFRQAGLDRKAGRAAHEQSLGRSGKLVRILETQLSPSRGG